MPKIYTNLCRRKHIYLMQRASQHSNQPASKEVKPNAPSSSSTFVHTMFSSVLNVWFPNPMTLEMWRKRRKTKMYWNIWKCAIILMAIINRRRGEMEYGNGQNGTVSKKEKLWNDLKTAKQ